MRTNEAENHALGKLIAERLNKCQNKEKTKVLIPLKGFSQLDALGNHFHNERCVEALEKAFATFLDPKIERILIEAHINDKAFARVAVEVLLGVMEKDVSE